MRILKLAGAMVLVLACTAVATATASATETLWPWLPGAEGTKFKGKSEKVSFQIKGGGTITCQKSEILQKEGEVTKEKTLALFKLHLGTGCTAFGSFEESLGDELGIILIHLELHDCLLVGGGLGVLITFLPLHLEIPSTKLLITEEGSFVAEVTPKEESTKTFKLAIEQKEGEQKLKGKRAECEGGSPSETLTTELDGSGTKLATAEEARGSTLEFETIAQEVMA